MTFVCIYIICAVIHFCAWMAKRDDGWSYERPRCARFALMAPVWPIPAVYFVTKAFIDLVKEAMK